MTLFPFLLFDAVFYTFLMSLPPIIQAIEEGFLKQIKEKNFRAENLNVKKVTPEDLLSDKWYILYWGFYQPGITVFAFFYLLSVIFIMPSLLYEGNTLGNTLGTLGAIITIFSTGGILASMIISPLYVYRSLKFAVKILKGEI